MVAWVEAIINKSYTICVAMDIHIVCNTNTPAANILIVIYHFIDDNIIDILIVVEAKSMFSVSIRIHSNAKFAIQMLCCSTSSSKRMSIYERLWPEQINSTAANIHFTMWKKLYSFFESNPFSHPSCAPAKRIQIQISVFVYEITTTNIINERVENREKLHSSSSRVSHD